MRGTSKIFLRAMGLCLMSMCRVVEPTWGMGKNIPFPIIRWSGPVYSELIERFPRCGVTWFVTPLSTI